MARVADSASLYVTKPKPRERPVSRSVTTLASTMSPQPAKAFCSSSLVVFQLRLPTNSFVLLFFFFSLVQ